MARIFTYKGKTIEELKAMSMDELVKILPSRIRRTLNRGLNEQNRKLLIKVKKTREKGLKKIIKTHCRDMPILPEMVGLTFGVHKGGVHKNNDDFMTIEIKPEMIGHFIGEFAMTRKEVKHSAPGIGATRSSMFISVK